MVVVVSLAGCAAAPIAPSPATPPAMPDVEPSGAPRIDRSPLVLQAFVPFVATMVSHDGAGKIDGRWEAAGGNGESFVLAMRSQDGNVSIATEMGSAASGKIDAEGSTRIVLLAGPAQFVSLNWRGIGYYGSSVTPATSSAELAEGERIAVGPLDLIATLQRKGAGAFTLIDPDGAERARFGLELTRHVALDKVGAWRIGCDGVCAGSLDLTLHGYRGG